MGEAVAGALLVGGGHLVPGTDDYNGVRLRRLPHLGSEQCRRGASRCRRFGWSSRT
jgi:hypothetical protein